MNEKLLVAFKPSIKTKLNSLKTSPQTRYLHMHGGRVDFSHTDEDLSGLSSPPMRRRGCIVCQGWIKGKKEWVIETWLDLCEEMGHGLRKQGISFAQGSWDPLSSFGLGNIYNMVCVCVSTKCTRPCMHTCMYDSIFMCVLYLCIASCIISICERKNMITTSCLSPVAYMSIFVGFCGFVCD